MRFKLLACVSFLCGSVVQQYTTGGGNYCQDEFQCHFVYQFDFTYQACVIECKCNLALDFESVTFSD